MFVIFISVTGLVSADSEETTFEVNKPLVSITVEPGELASSEVSIFNRGAPTVFSVAAHSLNSFFSVDRSSFFLDTGQSISMRLSLGFDSLSPGIYVGSVDISEGFMTVSIPVVLEVQSKSPLFDASIRELPIYSELRAGDVFIPQITLYNLRSLHPIATLRSSVYALDGTRIAYTVESVDVKNTLELSPALPLPESISDGPLILAVEIVAGTSHGTATTFVRTDNVSLSPPLVNNASFYYALVVIGILLVSFLVINYLWRRRMVTSATYWDDQLKQARSGQDGRRAHRKLMYQRQLLIEAYKKRYITSSTYKTTRAKLDALDRRLKKRL
ncbi:MAG: hypothetical protein AABX53_00290 [Nanoarchaeota archaeon]